MNLGNFQINVNPCDDAANRQNWRTLGSLVNQQLVNYYTQNGEVHAGWVRFQLTSVFSGQLATAHVYDESWTDTGEEITVYDIRDAYNGAAGTEKGLALLWGQNPVTYEVEILDFNDGGGGGGTASLAEGYCITLTGTDSVTVTHDAITSSAGIQGGDFDTDELQLWMHLPSATLATHAKWKTVVNYDTALDQIIWSDNGSWKAEEANKVTVKVLNGNPTLTIVSGSPDVLRVTIPYQEYTFYGKAGSTGNLTGDINLKTCS